MLVFELVRDVTVVRVLEPPLNSHAARADTEAMDPFTVLTYLVFSATLMRALLVAAKIVPPSCGRCGIKLERRTLGEPVCRCAPE